MQAIGTTHSQRTVSLVWQSGITILLTMHWAVPGLAQELVDRLVGLVETLRRLNLKKPPSVSETIDLARTLHLLGVTDVDVTDSSLTLNVLLKYRDDVQIAEAALTPRQWKKRA